MNGYIDSAMRNGPIFEFYFSGSKEPFVIDLYQSYSAVHKSIEDSIYKIETLLLPVNFINALTTVLPYEIKVCNNFRTVDGEDISYPYYFDVFQDTTFSVTVEEHYDATKDRCVSYTITIKGKITT